MIPAETEERTEREKQRSAAFQTHPTRDRTHNRGGMPIAPFARGNAPAWRAHPTPMVGVLHRLGFPTWLSQGPLLPIPSPSPGAGEERRAVAVVGTSSVCLVPEGGGRSPENLCPSHLCLGHWHAACPGRSIGAPGPHWAAPVVHSQASRGTQGRLWAQGRWRRDPAPGRQPAPIAAARLVTRSGGAGSRPALCGCRSRSGLAGAGWRVEGGG
nr:uncharacterized protein LOC128779236 [Desmodus rotundus]